MATIKFDDLKDAVEGYLEERTVTARADWEHVAYPYHGWHVTITDNGRRAAYTFTESFLSEDSRMGQLPGILHRLLCSLLAVPIQGGLAANLYRRVDQAERDAERAKELADAAVEAKRLAEAKDRLIQSLADHAYDDL